MKHVAVDSGGRIKEGLASALAGCCSVVEGLRFATALFQEQQDIWTFVWVKGCWKG